MLQVKRSQAEIQASAQEMLQESGLPELEERVLAFLCRNAGTLKLQSSIDQLTLLASQVRSACMLGVVMGSQACSWYAGLLAQYQH